ncbi:hypothetical protein C8_415 [Cannes 8 virus]|nr:hypothetical protein C8_415 [Cannes 8 virus]AVR53113.1 hypothetical protein MarSH_408 [Marseillevirus Shanghai 1]
MEGHSIENVIERLLDIKKQHGNIPVVLEVCYSGNYWLAPVDQLRVSKMHPNGDINEEEVTVVEIVGE